MLSDRVIFLNYPDAYKSLTVELCDFIEAAGYKCWYAHRDILGGNNYMERIVEAIKASKLMIFLLSEKSCTSRYVRREVELAYTCNIPIIPLRLEDFTVTGALEYSISENQWMNVWEKPFKEYFPQIISAVKRFLDVEEGEQKENELPESEDPPMPPEEEKALDIIEHKERIYLISKTITDSISPIVNFQIAWNYFWTHLELQKEKHPSEWEFKPLLPLAGIIALLRQPIILEEYNELVTLIGATVTAVILQSRTDEGKPNEKILSEITRKLVKKRELPESLIPHIVNLAIETVEVLGFDTFKEKSIEMKNKYKIYSNSGECELTEDGYKIQKALKDKYFIWIDLDNEILIQGEKVSIPGKSKKVLVILLKKFPYTVSYQEIYKGVMPSELQVDKTDTCVKNIVMKWIFSLKKTKLGKFIKPVYGEGYQMMKGSGSPNFCLIEKYCASTQDEDKKEPKIAVPLELDNKSPQREEEKPYKVYSHENSRNPQDATENDFEELERRALKENAFDVYFDSHKEEIIVNGKIKCFKSEKGPDAFTKMRLLEIILKNVGKSISIRKLIMDVWKGDEVKVGTIKQTLLRLNAFCDNKLKNFWKLREVEDYMAGEIKSNLTVYKSKLGVEFKYCLIERIEN